MDTTLKSSFLASKDERARKEIFALANRVAERLDVWGRDFPIIRSIRFKPLSIQLAASAPFCTVEELVTAGCGTLWIFAIDDAFDEELVPLEEMLIRSVTYRKLVFGESVTVDPRDPLAVVLQDVIRDLARYESFGSLREWWAASVMGTVEGMIQECRWRDEFRASKGQQLPTYEAYIRNGRYSIGGPPHFMTSIITLEDPASVAAIQPLHDLGLEASACIRLANDLRSYEKEVAEGNVNSVVLMQFLHGVPVEQARRMVQNEIAHGLQRCRALFQPGPTTSRSAERLIVDTAEFACEFYVSHDFHHELGG